MTHYTSFAYFLIILFASFCAEGQPRTELIAGAKWEFPGLAGPIAALQAPLGKPNSLALANNGDLLIADVGNNIVLRLSADGTLRVVAGNGALLGDPANPPLRTAKNSRSLCPAPTE